LIRLAQSDAWLFQISAGCHAIVTQGHYSPVCYSGSFSKSNEFLIMTIKLRMPFKSSERNGFTTPLRLLLATTAVFWMGAAQAEATAAKVTRQPTELRFRDFFSLPIGPTGLDFSDTLKQANGQAVRLVGYMVQQENPVPGRFMLAQRPVQMSEHADGEADDLPAATVLVRLDASQQDWLVPHVRGLVSVSGTLKVGRDEAPDGRVSWVQLHLDAESARSMNASEMAGYLHQRQHAH
jgi:hypothetical protein